MVVYETGDDFRRDVYSDAERYVRGAGHSALAKYGAFLDPGKLKRLAKQFERILVPRERRGRKNDPRIDAAYRDHRRGLSMAQIAEIHIPGYRAMNSSHKKSERKRLQAALRNRDRKRRLEPVS